MSRFSPLTTGGFQATYSQDSKIASGTGRTPHPESARQRTRCVVRVEVILPRFCGHHALPFAHNQFARQAPSHRACFARYQRRMALFNGFTPYRPVWSHSVGIGDLIDERCIDGIELLGFGDNTTCFVQQYDFNVVADFAIRADSIGDA